MTEGTRVDTEVPRQGSVSRRPWRNPYPVDLWAQAIAEVTRILDARARTTRRPITYMHLTHEVQTISFHHQQEAFHELLGAVSRAEAAAGRGMLSAYVVHAARPDRGLPGPGFFRLAAELGLDITDRRACWQAEKLLVDSVRVQPARP